MAVGIKEVARVAGVSPATVSRVLGNGPVSDTLRAQVEAAVRATGYRPNLSARRLRSRHTQTIGLIVADIRNPFFTAISRAVEDVAFRSGLRVILCNTDEDPKKEALYLRLMEEERVTGVILAPTRSTGAEPPALPTTFPIVLVDRASPFGDQDAVTLDNVLAATILVDHLHRQGCRHIIGLFGNASSTGIERHAGYVASMHRLGLPDDALFIAPTLEAAERAIRDRLTGPAAPRPDAVLASNSLLLAGAVKAVRASGLAIPTDLAVAGFDNESWTDLVEPGITVIEQPVEVMGQTAISMLLERLASPNAPHRKVVLGGQLIVRKSTRRAPAAP
jgi:LacI family fructose operon transcriptional repressor